MITDCRCLGALVAFDDARDIDDPITFDYDLLQKRADFAPRFGQIPVSGGPPRISGFSLNDSQAALSHRLLLRDMLI
jgi:hypothetical protein